MKRDTCVTKRTLKRNARRFARDSTSAWHGLNAFVNEFCGLNRKTYREKFMDKLCEVVDEYVTLNCAILMWCHKNGVDPCDFVCEVENMGFADLREYALGRNRS